MCSQRCASILQEMFALEVGEMMGWVGLVQVVEENPKLAEGCLQAVEMRSEAVEVPREEVDWAWQVVTGY